MKQQKVYIQAASQISIQEPLSEQWMQEPLSYSEPFVNAVNPPFKEYMAPGEVRRMGNLMKRALVTTLQVLQKTGIEHPDAMMTGTCLGSLDYTVRFLEAMTENGEETLSPTWFMQSTHNTVGSSLAIYTKSHGYNVTYSHGSISFDLAVQDAWMQMQLGKIKNALVGGHDEMVESYYQLMKKSGYVGQEGMVPCGEVAMSMMLNTDESADSLCELAGIRLCHRPTKELLQQHIDNLLSEADMTMDDLSVVMTGMNGNPANDQLYKQTIDTFFGGKPLLNYKHLFGENYTVSALGLYASAHILKNGDMKSVLFLNQTTEGDYTLILLKKA